MLFREKEMIMFDEYRFSEALIRAEFRHAGRPRSVFQLVPSV